MSASKIQQRIFMPPTSPDNTVLRALLCMQELFPDEAVFTPYICNLEGGGGEVKLLGQTEDSAVPIDRKDCLEMCTRLSWIGALLKAHEVVGIKSMTDPRKMAIETAIKEALTATYVEHTGADEGAEPSKDELQDPGFKWLKAALSRGIDIEMEKGATIVPQTSETPAAATAEQPTEEDAATRLEREMGKPKLKLRGQ